MSSHTACPTCSGTAWATGTRRKKQRRGERRSGAPPVVETFPIPCGACGASGVVPTAAAAPAAAAPQDAARPLVVVAGGGVAGLALALALQQRGWTADTVRVLERDPGPSHRRAGYALTMQQGASALRSLGAADALAGAGVSSKSHWTFDAASGAAVGCFGRACDARSDTSVDPAASAARRCNVHLPRVALQRIVADRLLPGTVRYGCRVTGFSAAPSGDGVRVAYDDAAGRAEVSTAAALCLADGVRSRLVPAAPPLRPAGCVAILGIVPAARVRACPAMAVLQARVCEFIDAASGTRLYTMPFDVDGAVMYQLSFLDPSAKRWSAETGAAAREAALARVAGWCDAAVACVDAAAAGDTSAYGLEDRDPEETDAAAAPAPAACGRVATLGDAAHAMTPFKGQGANQALVDALDLARAIYASLANADLEARLGAYDAAMRKRAGRKVRASRAAVAPLHSAAALQSEGEMVSAAGARLGTWDGDKIDAKSAGLGTPAPTAWQASGRDVGKHGFDEAGAASAGRVAAGSSSS